MTRLPLLVGACLLAASVAGPGALAGPGATQPFAASAVDSAVAATANSTTNPAAVSTTEPSANSTTDSTTDAADNSTTDSTDNEYLLVVEDAETGERLLVEPVSDGTTVALNYTHSVEKTPVLDVYEVNGTELEMVRMEFHSYGAGLPARADVNVTENGTFVFDPEGSYDHVYVTPGTIAGHELIVGEETHDLVALSNASSVKIYVANRSATTAGATGETTGAETMVAAETTIETAATGTTTAETNPVSPAQRRPI